MSVSVYKNVRQSVRPSILTTLELIKQQVEYHCFADLRFGHIDRLYDDLCLVISEILVMEPDSAIKINGIVMKVHLVQEVFESLRCAHLQLVFHNFQYVSDHVFNKKAYLRTALYNSFFELEAHSINSPDSL